jgi:hypothetical protein
METASVQTSTAVQRALVTTVTTLTVLVLFAACVREPEADVSTYVAAYHWGFALFDAEGRELEVLEVRQGSTVELVAVNEHAREAIQRLPGPVASAILAVDWEERAHEDAEAGRIRDPHAYGVSLERELQVAHDHHHDTGPAHEHWSERPGAPPGFSDHGLKVVGYEVQIDRLASRADRPQRLVFVADRVGSFAFECTRTCGFGHPHPRELLVVR